MKDLTIRPLLPEEEPIIATLQRDAESRRFLPEPDFSVQKAQRWGIWYKGTFIGWVEILGTPPLLWIARIEIDARYRYQGWGSIALKHILEYFGRRARIHEVRAAVHQENIPALRFFEKMGFEPISEADFTGEFVLRYSFSTQSRKGSPNFIS
ncbi:MAG: GNAT family N-acetyltransferase [Bacteroidia bacterium]|nr:GNAT family N-acetyltransferase [Bacteroidia bacterium]MDW8235170.1 GNAT family N-acetyltransferase [Bacteroidia bacterium]